MGETDGRNYKKRERKKLREKGDVGGGVEGPPSPLESTRFHGGAKGEYINLPPETVASTLRSSASWELGEPGPPCGFMGWPRFQGAEGGGAASQIVLGTRPDIQYDLKVQK